MSDTSGQLDDTVQPSPAVDATLPATAPPLAAEVDVTVAASDAPGHSVTDDTVPDSIGASASRVVIRAGGKPDEQKLAR